MGSTISKVGRRGQVVIPSSLRARFGLTEGAVFIAEETPEGVLIRPAVAVPVEVYTPQRKAEFLLNNAIDAEDYARALEEARKLGVDPASIAHRKPGED